MAKSIKIIDIGYNKAYIGSTTQSLSNRMSEHKKDYRNYKCGKPVSYKTSYSLFDEYDVTNCKIELIELFPCGCKEELRKREGFHIKNTECINKYIAGRTAKEYRIDRKEYLSEYDKKYRETHIDAVREKDKRKYERNREAILQRKKEYYEMNKEKVKEKIREWCETHKEYIKAQRSKVIECPICGGHVTRQHKLRHERSNTHQNALKDLNKKEQIIEI